ncbi:hypothetical protein BDQ17DRAFT_1392943 [Cyathus striatus]|nr:hypothetical protein BDQ17DRAFT_1392943 [Cyathus striatus]
MSSKRKQSKAHDGPRQKKSAVSLTQLGLPSSTTAASNPNIKSISSSTHAKLNDFLPHRDEYLDELLHHDGQGDFVNDICSSCNAYDGVFQCLDCACSKGLQCCNCIINDHKYLPLHRIEIWTGTNFDRILLQVLGLQVQLGNHHESCPSPEPASTNFVVFDISGIHPVSVNFCGCMTANAKHIQLMRAKWFPTTITRPQTAFTFDCLDYSHKLSLQSKITAYDFYHLGPHFNRYNEFQYVFRIWHNLHVLKRRGQGHDPAGPDATSPGELTVECPACPHPQCNLPADWQLRGAYMFLYILYIAVDANFKLKMKNCGINDVELSPGWGTYVNEKDYQSHLSNYIDEPEINSCESQHDAIVWAGIRSTPGYAISGAGLTLCARHSLVRPNGVGDLQKGEKYCNMDFIVLSSLKNLQLPRIVITYDIGCQWSKNLRKHINNMPPDLHIPHNTIIDVGVPSWHINAHGDACRSNFSLMHMPGAVETSWANTNPLAASLREMGSANRHESLDNHWNSWNFHKIIGLLFIKKYKDACSMSAAHSDIFQKFTATFPESVIKNWEDRILAWEKDKMKTNPYDDQYSYATLKDIQLEIMREDALHKSYQGYSRIPVVTFLTTGFDIELRQYQLQHIVTNNTQQLENLEVKHYSLLQQIESWREAQDIHMSAIASELGPLIRLENNEAEMLKLYLPSKLPLHLRQDQSIQEIMIKEKCLRIAQAEDSLAEIRRHWRIIKGLWRFKKLNISGTGNKANTRMNSLYTQFSAKTESAATKYCIAFEALQSLEPDGDWSTNLKSLKNEDIHGPGQDDDEITTSKGCYIPSWIWLIPQNKKDINTDETEEDSHEALSSEWAKVKARKDRWSEEVVVKFCEWQSEWWMNKTDGRSLCKTWLPLLQNNGITPEWAINYMNKESQDVEEHDDDDDVLGDDDETSNFGNFDTEDEMEENI